MKTTNPIRYLPHIALALLVTALAGCKTTTSTYQKGADTAAGLTEAGNKISAGKTNIDLTLVALNELVNNPQGDLVPKYQKFNDSVSALEATATHVNAKVTEMRDTGSAYFEAWDLQLAEIKNEDIKKRSNKRKAEVQKKFSEIKKSYSDAQESFKPFMNELKDIQTALSTDLTVGGVSAVKGAAASANKNGTKVKKSLDKLATQFKDLGVAMASATAEPQPAPAK